MARKKSKEVEKKPKTKNQVVLTAFILIFPVLLLAVVGMEMPNWFLQICLFFYEAVLIKNFIDDYYKE